MNDQLIEMEAIRGLLARFDCRVHQPSIFLPLYSYTTRVLPVAGVRLVDFVQCTQPQSVGGICDILAEWPPHTLCPFQSTLSCPVGTFCVNIYWVDT